jgi:hypothetical protein
MDLLEAMLRLKKSALPYNTVSTSALFLFRGENEKN